jgi:hypothetical protein
MEMNTTVRANVNIRYGLHGFTTVPLAIFCIVTSAAAQYTGDMGSSPGQNSMPMECRTQGCPLDRM